MFQERYNRIVLPFFFLSELVIVLGVYYFIQFGFRLTLEPEMVFLFGIWAIPALYFRSYRAPRTHSIRAALNPVLKTLVVFSILLFGLEISGWLPLRGVSSYLYLIFYVAVLQIAFSLTRFGFFHHYRLKGKNIRQAVLIDPLLMDENMDNLKKDGLHYGYHFIERIPENRDLETRLNSILSRKKIDLVFLREGDSDVTEIVSAFCDENGIRLKLILNLSRSTGRKAGLDILGGLPIMDVRHEPLLYLGNRVIKRTVDMVMAILSIIFIMSWLPFVVKIAQAISYPGPLFFSQERIGINGKIFNMVKFRTMVYTKDYHKAKDGKSEKTHEQDERISGFGKLLRRTNLDEYPQFFNVLFGSMSTVGPRPHMAGEDKVLEQSVPKYRVRRFVKPGVTGWAAINGFRGGTDDMELMSKRTEYDIWYLENWTFWLDIKIMAITIWQMLTFRIPKAY